MNVEMTLCQVASCDRPSDGWFVCRTCGEAFGTLLAEMPWMLEQLDLVVSRQTRYTTQSSGKAAETPLMFNAKASDVRGRILTELDTAVRLVADANEWEPDHVDGATAAYWLDHRISALRLHAIGGEIINSIKSWYSMGMVLIDRPVPRQYLGDCINEQDDETCPGRIYGHGRPEARCDTCGMVYQADELRDRLLAALHDRNCTASEIARLSTYLGLPLDRERVRKVINQWHKRGQIVSKNPRAIEEAKAALARGETVPQPDPEFRFGDALGLLQRHVERVTA